MRRTTLFLSATLLILAIPVILAEVPSTISYQGILTGTTGTVLPDGIYTLTFRLYNAETSGTPLWEEIQTVPVIKGAFNVILGKVNPLNLAFDRQYWFEMQVGTAPALAPRIPLTASPYSLDKRSGGGAGDGHSLDAADGSPTDAVFVDNDGNVGIGTTNPTYRLQSEGAGVDIAASDGNAGLFLADNAKNEGRITASRLLQQEWIHLVLEGQNGITLISEAPAGIALAAIQELKREKDALAAENDALRIRLEALEAVVKSLVERLPNTQKARGDGETGK